MAVSLPAEVVYGKVTGSARLAVADGLDPDTLPDGEPATGTVTFTPAVDRIVLGTSNTILIIAPQTAMFDENGDFEIDLVATDIPDANPLNWTYNVQVVIDGMQRPWTFPCKIEGGTTVDISDIAPTKSSGGVFFTKGDPGKSAYQVAVDNGFIGTEAEWLTSLAFYPAPTHETIQLGATATLPTDKSVLTVRATEATTVDIAPAIDGTIVTVHFAEGYQYVTWAAGIAVTGETYSSETWLVLVHEEGAWKVLVSIGEEMDTGWRDISSAIDTSKGWMAPPDSYIRIRRIGNVVHLQASMLSGGTVFATSSTETMTTAGRLGVGWAPLETFIVLSEYFPPDPAKIPILRINKAFNGTTRLVVGYNATGGGTVAEWEGFGGSASWITYDPWPETLPGVAE